MRSVPWIPDLALGYLNGILDNNMSVFEYGSGGSTIYFGNHAKNIVSIEHSLEWYQEIKPRIAANAEYRLIEPKKDAIGDDKSNPNHYTSNPLMADFRNYVSAIDDYDNFDIIFIDGRSRSSCLKHSANKIKSGGWIILDNADRDYYLSQTHHLFDEWETVTFFGYGPYIDWPWKTIFMRSPL